MTNVPSGDHAPTPGDYRLEVAFDNDYSGPVNFRSLWQNWNAMLQAQNANERRFQVTPEVPQENPPSQSNIGRSPLAGVMFEFGNLTSFTERIANLVQGQGVEQAYTELMLNQSLPDPGPPQRNQFAAHGYSEDNVLDQQNKPILFWNGPRHQQFHVVANLDARLVVTDGRVMPSRHEEGTCGFDYQHYQYRLRTFCCDNTSFGVYVLEALPVSNSEVVQFFRHLAGVVNEYEFIAHSRSRTLEQRAESHSIADLRRSVREEVYAEVLFRVRQEFAERERNRPPAAPAVLPAIDTDQGRSIVL